MKRIRVVVFALAVLTVGAGMRSPAAPVLEPVAAAEGRGLLARLACGACVGSYATLALTGWEALWLISLAGPCGEVCLAAS